VRYLPAGKQGYFTEIHKADTEMHKENLKIIIINGPNLNLLGKRETNIYGNMSFEEYFKKLRSDYHQFELEYYQSNVEGEIINKIQEVGFSYNGIILNAGGYTHTSVAIADAIKSIETPVIEVHISNILSREEFRHKSLIGPYCKGSIMGFGLKSYHLALASFS
jgi:3-dehydroquinate dehydratase-2